jgi:hypothetical protein
MPAMNKPLVEIQITSDRVWLRGQLSEFEASALLQDALAHQGKLKDISRDQTISAFFKKYQALIFYPIVAAFALGLSFAFVSISTHSTHTAEHYESY